MKKFEYKQMVIMSLGADYSMVHNITGANQIGDEGWELVTIIQVGTIYLGYFKREC